MIGIRATAWLLLAGACAMGQYRRGVNVAGAEFGQSQIPGVFGRDYWFNSENTFRYFGEKGLGLIRVPLLWERLQPAPGGPLDAAYLNHLKDNIAWAGAHGAEVIIDIHNFGRYGGYILDNVYAGTVRVSSADFADLWVRLSNEFKFAGAVYAYDLMNEPHDMGTANWEAISQVALDAIRANQDDKLVLVPGDSWSSANRWVTNHPRPWIQDPANNFAYEAHQYFDHDESGTYGWSYDAELARNSDLANVGRTRVRHFLDWRLSNNVRGIVDEYGIPDSDARWFTVLENFFAALDAAGVDGAYWAAGEWWGSYPLSVQPGANFTPDRPQMAALQAHAPGGYLTALSAASVTVARATAGSLVTLWGKGFTDQTATTPGSAYPTALGDVTVQVTDASGAVVLAGLLYISPRQINLQMPPLLAPGRATLTVLRGAAQTAAGSIQVAETGPSIFTANSAGFGPAAAQIIRVRPDNSQNWEPVTAIDFGDPSDRLFLALYGTGVRSAGAALRIGETDMRVDYAGTQGQYPGLDQVQTAELPRSLAGAGAVDVKFRIGGINANTVTITFR
ncbi:MAG: cellulase family glycosylhydrolase [Acidobacteriia bacterium]|nr:cellulase family glycosylhydrolase [Terriglobia bacterium]